MTSAPHNAVFLFVLPIITLAKLFNHIEKTAKLVVKGDYYNPHEMLEAVVKLNLTSDVKDGLIIHDDSDNKFWTVFFKKEASLKQKVKKLNNK